MFKKYPKGLVIGKFMPFHKGHEYLINFAKEYCDHLFVIVDCLKDQTIDPITRKTWIESTIPNITVIALDTFMPQDPSECSDFWDIWRNAILSRTGKIDVLVAAMDYGWKLSEELKEENSKILLEINNLKEKILLVCGEYFDINDNDKFMILENCKITLSEESALEYKDIFEIEEKKHIDNVEVIGKIKVATEEIRKKEK